MTLFFNPTDKQRVLIELLPSNAIGVTASIGQRKLTEVIAIKTWAPRISPMACVSSGDDDTFLEEVCYDCDYHTDSVEVDLEGLYGYWQGEEISLYGTVEVSSPCPCYENGLGEVEFPCANGSEGPEAEDSDEELSPQFMSYTIERKLNFAYQNSFAVQQALYFDSDGYIYPTSSERAINTFDGDNRICWGELAVPLNLRDIELSYTTGKCNEDLLSFEGHLANTETILAELEEIEESLEDYTPVDNIYRIKYEDRPMALALATADQQMQTYMLLAASGACIKDRIAFVPVYLYPNVDLGNSLHVDVWVSDPLSTGCRLVFYIQDNHTKAAMPECYLLGQIPIDFDLSPCKSTNVQSSDAEELVKA